ncbi:alanine racemase [Aquicella lusitana]|uniref:Alanine racemase n=1 Tax=Aquicella lusitana TaxID=254246 RepID=A0A370GTG7_9COXI|nr:alanine racemase [Aquicella lusitana]RDI45213.1 alanine racemase [Aquicella lusitana]VVC72717.1 Alanine racemase, biosynthetic [Aquicella lusitana]
MSRPTFMTIDLSALTHNFERVRDLAPDRFIIAMVKANAYGHGVVSVARALPGAAALGVASLEEGIRLREAGITKPIVLIEGLFYPEELTEAVRHDFTLVVHHLPHVEMLEKAQVVKPLSVWLKINTGMHRLGIDPAQTEKIYARLAAAASVKKPIGLMTHFAEADRADSMATPRQVEVFNQATAHLPGPRSLCNSAGIIAWPNAHGDWVRPGLMLYGASPFADKTGLDHGLAPVMTLWSRLIAITEVKKGGKVGYGGTWTAPEDMRVGVVGVGYGDGYPQFAQNGTPVLVKGVECPLAGRVSMDMLTVDLRNQPQASIGDPVVLWGKGLPVERIAQHCNTSAYEILTRMTPRPNIEMIS